MIPIVRLGQRRFVDFYVRSSEGCKGYGALGMGCPKNIFLIFSLKSTLFKTFLIIFIFTKYILLLFDFNVQIGYMP